MFDRCVEGGKLCVSILLNTFYSQAAGSHIKDSCIFISTSKRAMSTFVFKLITEYFHVIYHVEIFVLHLLSARHRSTICIVWSLSSYKETLRVKGSRESHSECHRPKRKEPRPGSMTIITKTHKKLEQEVDGCLGKRVQREDRTTYQVSLTWEKGEEYVLTRQAARQESW